MANGKSDEYLSIGEVAAQAGIRTSALRYYESIRLLPEPKHINERRCYEPTVLQQLTIVQLAQKAGFAIKEIDELLHGFAAEAKPAERWQAIAHEKLAQLEATIARAQQMKARLEYGLRCNCLRMEDCAAVLEGCTIG